MPSTRASRAPAKRAWRACCRTRPRGTFPLRQPQTPLVLIQADRSVNRVFQQQLFDNNKQKAIDALLGNLATSRKVRIFNPIHDTLRAQLRARAADFTSYEPTTIWVGTYNLNGRPPGSESLLPWLIPVEGPDPALLVVSFQEIVPLSPQQIMSTDPEKKCVSSYSAARAWIVADWFALMQAPPGGAHPADARGPPRQEVRLCDPAVGPARRDGAHRAVQEGDRGRDPERRGGDEEGTDSRGASKTPTGADTSFTQTGVRGLAGNSMAPAPASKDL